MFYRTDLAKKNGGSPTSFLHQMDIIMPMMIPSQDIWSGKLMAIVSDTTEKEENDIYHKAQNLSFNIISTL